MKIDENSKSKSNLYCIYCGEDIDKGHSLECPVIKSIPEMVRGMKPLLFRNEETSELIYVPLKDLENTRRAAGLTKSVTKI